ncbi:MAG: xylose isomerase, partial [Oscillospiraceae bacterium]|nr:xylose isomerase [Oscillospiraceae bacterium]
MSEFFGNIGKIPFEGKGSTNPLAFKYYNPDEVVAGKTMREQLKFALSWWHTMGGDGTDMFGCGTADKTWGQSDSVARAKAKVDAAFEIMDKLSIDYFCFHDRDLSPEYGTLAETNAKLDEITDYIAEKMKANPSIKLLWGTAKCFDHPRYMHGAGTSPSADVFAYAAAQIKKAVEATVKLGGNGYVFWGGREGYETLLNTNMGLELDNMARLMKMTVDYARSIGYKGDFYIEPKPKEPTKHQYDFDTATVLGFLRKYGLEKDFKMNIEANHATLAQHTFQHELRVARDNGVFGSIDANQGDMLLGWDTDQFPTNVYDAALCM